MSSVFEKNESFKMFYHSLFIVFILWLCICCFKYQWVIFHCPYLHLCEWGRSVFWSKITQPLTVKWRLKTQWTNSWCCFPCMRLTTRTYSFTLASSIFLENKKEREEGKYCRKTVNASPNRCFITVIPSGMVSLLDFRIACLRLSGWLSGGWGPRRWELELELRSLQSKVTQAGVKG